MSLTMHSTSWNALRLSGSPALLLQQPRKTRMGVRRSGRKQQLSRVCAQPQHHDEQELSTTPAADRQRQQFQEQMQQLQARYTVPWDIWDFIQVAAAVWVINMAIPFTVLSATAHMQGTQLASLPLPEKEVLGLCCQVLQLGGTCIILSTNTKKHQPLPRPWFLVQGGAMPVLQGFATAVAAVGSGVLLSGLMTGHSDGAEEWRHLAGLGDSPSTAALVLGAVLFAPLTEEVFFRGYVLPSLTKWTHPAVAVVLTGLLFASAHPADAFLPEALLGWILSLSLLAADGNLLVPLLAHSLYNVCVLGTEFLL